VGDEGDERKNVFGIVPQQLGGSGAALRYLNRAFRKYRIAEWHLRRFEQLEDELRVEDLFKFERGEPAMRPQAHADGTVLQLAAVFDAFACAVAHKLEVTKPDPDKADFARDYATLATKIGGNLGAIIEDTGSHRGFYELQAYRNLAAHRGVLGENQGGTSGLVASEANRVRLLLPEWVPADVPDIGASPVRPILRRVFDWARPRIQRLWAEADKAWNMEEEARGELFEKDDP